MNRIPNEMLIGRGRAELLVRLLGRGESIASCVTKFGVSKDRVRKLRGLACPPAAVVVVTVDTPEAPEEPEVVVPVAVEAPEGNILDGLDDALEASPEPVDAPPEA